MMNMSHKQYKAILLDLDGVVVKDGVSLPTPRVVAAIARAQEWGVVVSLVTGRPLQRVRQIADILNITVPVVVEGGARIHDFGRQEDLFTNFIEPAVAHAIAHFVLDRNLPAIFSSLEHTYSTPAHIALRNIYQAGGGFNIREHIDTQYEPLAEPARLPPITGIALYPLEEGMEEVWDVLSKFPSLHAVEGESKSFRGWRVITINDIHGTKQHGVMELGKIVGIDPHDMIGVGDQDVDYPLLMACGLKVAMGNAVQSLKDIADYVAPSVEEDGLVDVIDKFLLNRNEPFSDRA